MDPTWREEAVDLSCQRCHDLLACLHIWIVLSKGLTMRTETNPVIPVSSRIIPKVVIYSRLTYVPSASSRILVVSPTRYGLLSTLLLTGVCWKVSMSQVFEILDTRNCRSNFAKHLWIETKKVYRMVMFSGESLLRLRQNK